MAPGTKAQDALQRQKEKRQKKMLIALAPVLLLLLAWQGPGIFKQITGGTPPPETPAAPATSTEPAAADPTIAAAPTTAGGADPAVVVAAPGTLPDTDGVDDAGPGQLIAFDRFLGKDPFKQQVVAKEPAVGGAPPARRHQSPPPPRRRQPAHDHAPESRPGTAPTSAALMDINGNAETVCTDGTFPLSDPIFRLVVGLECERQDRPRERHVQRRPQDDHGEARQVGDAGQPARRRALRDQVRRRPQVLARALTAGVRRCAGFRAALRGDTRVRLGDARLREHPVRCSEPMRAKLRAHAGSREAWHRHALCRRVWRACGPRLGAPQSEPPRLRLTAPRPTWRARPAAAWIRAAPRSDRSRHAARSGRTSIGLEAGRLVERRGDARVDARLSVSRTMIVMSFTLRPVVPAEFVMASQVTYVSTR